MGKKVGVGVEGRKRDEGQITMRWRAEGAIEEGNGRGGNKRLEKGTMGEKSKREGCVGVEGKKAGVGEQREGERSEWGRRERNY